MRAVPHAQVDHTPVLELEIAQRDVFMSYQLGCAYNANSLWLVPNVPIIYKQFLHVDILDFILTECGWFI